MRRGAAFWVLATNVATVRKGRRARGFRWPMWPVMRAVAIAVHLRDALTLTARAVCMQVHLLRPLMQHAVRNERYHEAGRLKQELDSLRALLMTVLNPER